MGDSIAVNGTCLTVTAFDSSGFSADAVWKTLEITNLSELKTGSLVNLERALSINGRLDGHIVQGHIDGVGRISNIQNLGHAYKLEISLAGIPDFHILTVRKGSIAVNGISLTIAEKKEDKVTISIIPFTWENTVLKNSEINDKINIEFDIFGKYAANYFQNLNLQKKQDITIEKLMENGFI